MKLKLQKALQLIALISLVVALRVAPAAASNLAVTGGTNGPLCTSGGYFTPSSATVTSGSTVTITVPADDPYAGGVEVHGFPQGDFVVARGASVTTDAITADVSYYGTWPSTGCMKGSGTITVSAPAPAPTSPTPTTPTSGGTTSTSSTTKTSSPTTSKTTPAPTTTPPTTSTNPTTPTPSTATTQTAPHTTDTTVAASNTKSPALKNVATFGGGGLVLLGMLAFVVWRVLMRRRLDTSVAQPTATQPVQPQTIQTPQSSDKPQSKNGQ